MALETKAVDSFSAKQIFIFATVRLVTSATALPEGRLVQVFFGVLLRLIAMAAKADIDRVRFRQSWLPARVGIVAFGTIARRARMLHLRILDLIRFFRVAGQAELFRSGFLQHHPTILGRLVTDGAGGLPGFKRRMSERQYQLPPGGLVRIVAGEATCGDEGLLPMSLEQLGILRIMTIHAQSRAVHFQLEIEFPLSSFPCLMDGVAGLATYN